MWSSARRNFPKSEDPYKRKNAPIIDEGIRSVDGYVRVTKAYVEYRLDLRGVLLTIRAEQLSTWGVGGSSLDVSPRRSKHDESFPWM